MTKVIEATGDGACLFNAVAIGLGIEILSGRLDGYNNTPGYQRLLDVFADHHPHFKPKSWDNLKQWLLYYHNSRDWELVLSPVLFKLNQQYQPQLERDLINELAIFIRNNLADIKRGFAPYQLNYDYCPKIDNLHHSMKAELISRMLPLIRKWDPRWEFSDFREHVAREAMDHVLFLINLVNNDQNAYQRGYGCYDLKDMADALSLTLIENVHDKPLDTHPKIYLQNEEQHWNVYCSDADFDQLLHFGPQRLEMTSHEAFRGAKQVASPTQDHLVTYEETATDSQLAGLEKNDGFARNYSRYIETGIQVRGRSKRFFGEPHVYHARWRGEVPSGYESTRHVSGDALKSRILDVLESKIASMTAEELLDLINDISTPDSDSADRKAWEILATGEGLLTRALGSRTGSIKTFNQMVSHYGQKVGFIPEEIDSLLNPRQTNRRHKL